MESLLAAQEDHSVPPQVHQIALLSLSLALDRSLLDHHVEVFVIGHQSPPDLRLVPQSHH